MEGGEGCDGEEGGEDIMVRREGENGRGAMVREKGEHGKGEMVRGRRGKGR